MHQGGRDRVQSKKLVVAGLQGPRTLPSTRDVIECPVPSRLVLGPPPLLVHSSSLNSTVATVYRYSSLFTARNQLGKALSRPGVLQLSKISYLGINLAFRVGIAHANSYLLKSEAAGIITNHLYNMDAKMYVFLRGAQTGGST